MCLVLVESYGGNTKIFCHIIGIVDIVVTIALHTQTIEIWYCENNWQLSSGYFAVIKDDRCHVKPIHCHFWHLCSSKISYCWKEVQCCCKLRCLRLQAVMYYVLSWAYDVYNLCMYLVCSSWSYPSWPASNTGHSLSSLPSCTFATAQETSISTSYFSL